jgi:MFS family permease
MYRRSLMSSFHAAFSIGGIAGSLTGGLAAAAGIGVVSHLAVAGILLGAVALVVPRWLLPSSVDAAGDGAPEFSLRIPRAVIVLGLVGFCALLAEGAMADWTAVYLRDVVGTGAGVAAMGYAVFSVGMALGRLSGDRVMDRTDARAIVRWGGLVAATGLTLSLAVDVPLVTATGFGLVGIGLAIIVPIAFGTAGKLPEVARGQGIAAVTTLSYLGFLSGPPSIGLIASATSLRVALALVVGLLVGMTLLAGAIRRD